MLHNATFCYRLNRSRCRLGADLGGGWLKWTQGSIYWMGIKVRRIVRRCGLSTEFFEHLFVLKRSRCVDGERTLRATFSDVAVKRNCLIVCSTLATVSYPASNNGSTDLRRTRSNSEANASRNTCPTPAVSAASAWYVSRRWSALRKAKQVRAARPRSERSRSVRLDSRSRAAPRAEIWSVSPAKDLRATASAEWQRSRTIRAAGDWELPSFRLKLVDWRDDGRSRLKEKSHCSWDWLHEVWQLHDDWGHISTNTAQITLVVLDYRYSSRLVPCVYS